MVRKFILLVVCISIIFVSDLYARELRQHTPFKVAGGYIYCFSITPCSGTRSPTLSCVFVSAEKQKTTQPPRNIRRGKK